MKYFSILLFILIWNVEFSQNLIPNPGFELGGCPAAQYGNGSTVMPTSWSQFPTPAAFGADYGKNGCYTSAGAPNNGNAWIYGITGVSTETINCLSGPCTTVEKKQTYGVKATLTSTLTTGNSYSFSVSIRQAGFANNGPSSIHGVGIWIFPAGSPPSENSCFNPPNMFFPVSCNPSYVIDPPDFLIPMSSLTSSYQTFTYNHTAGAGDNTIGIAGWYGDTVNYNGSTPTTTSEMGWCLDDASLVVGSPCGACLTPTPPTNATYTWTGCVDTDWFDPCNWDSGTVPTSTKNVIIPNTTNKPLITGATANCFDITVQSSTGARLDISSTGGGALNVTKP